MKQNLFNVSALKKQIDDLQSQIIKDGELVKKQQESIVKQSVDFLMSIIDIYDAVKLIETLVKELLTSDDEKTKELIKQIALLKVYCFESDEKYDETVKQMEETFGRKSVHTQPTEDEIKQFEVLNTEKQHETQSKNGRKVLKMKKR